MKVKISINNHSVKQYASLETFFAWVNDTFCPDYFMYHTNYNDGVWIYRKNGEDIVMNFEVRS